MILLELFTASKYGEIFWDQTKGTVWRGRFQASGMPFAFEFVKTPKGWHYNFEVSEEFADQHDIDDVQGNTGLAKQQTDRGSKSTAIAVLGTAATVIEQFLKKQQPDVLYFSGDKDYGKDRIYAMMQRSFTTKFVKFGYESTMQDDGDAVVFIFKKLNPAV